MKNFDADASGATAIEYSLIATLIGAVIVTALSTMGADINSMIAQVAPVLR